MSHRTITFCFVAAVVLAAVLFSNRPPRAQAHLAAIEEVTVRTLQGQVASRIYFVNGTGNSEAYVWARYFAAPHLLLDGASNAAGDTILWLQRTGRGEALEPSIGRLLADHTKGDVHAILYVTR